MFDKIFDKAFASSDNEESVLECPYCGDSECDRSCAETEGAQREACPSCGNPECDGSCEDDEDYDEDDFDMDFDMDWEEDYGDEACPHCGNLLDECVCDGFGLSDDDYDCDYVDK